MERSMLEVGGLRDETFQLHFAPKSQTRATSCQGLTADQTQSFPTSEDHFQAEKHSPVHLDLTLSFAIWAEPLPLPPGLNPQLCHLGLTLNSATWT